MKTKYKKKTQQKHPFWALCGFLLLGWIKKKLLQDYLIRFQYIVHASCNSSKTDKFDFINSCSILHYISSYIMEINIIRILWLLFHGVLLNNPEVVFQVNIYKYNVSVVYNFVEKIDIEFAAFVPLLWFVDVFTGISLFHFQQREKK